MNTHKVLINHKNILINHLNNEFKYNTTIKIISDNDFYFTIKFHDKNSSYFICPEQCGDIIRYCITKCIITKYGYTTNYLYSIKSVIDNIYNIINDKEIYCTDSPKIVSDEQTDG